jgi:predicted DsbA family dithiol-disulfide isomerase
MTGQRPTLTVDIVSDVVCPWCIIGYKQLVRASSMIEDRADIAVRWHPFQLAPGLAAGGQNIADYTRDRYGATPEQSRGNRARIVDLGKNLGIDFRYNEDSRIYNSHRAHELLTWAADSGKQTALKLALFEAYFTDQTDISDENVLIAAVERAGLDGDEARAVLADGRFAAAVDTEVAYWQDQNVTGVPAFVINGKYMIPGAQNAEVFVQVLEKVLDKEGG